MNKWDFSWNVSFCLFIHVLVITLIKGFGLGSIILMHWNKSISIIKMLKDGKKWQSGPDL